MSPNVPAGCDVFAVAIKETEGFQQPQKCGGVKLHKGRKPGWGFTEPEPPKAAKRTPFADAIDGCKLSSNASKEWSGTIAELGKKRDKLKNYIFTLRGEKKVNSQWKLYCIVHNIGKCMKSLAEKRRASR
jgi:hypothetical protein